MKVTRTIALALLVGLTFLSVWVVSVAGLEGESARPLPGPARLVGQPGPSGDPAHARGLSAEPFFTSYLPMGTRDYNPNGYALFGYGVVAFGGDDAQSNVGHLQTMGLDWVRLLMKWERVEPQAGSYQWGTWDATLDAYGAAGTKVLLTISNAPDWARPPGDDRGVDGLPEDPATYAAFVQRVLQRYRGKVHAIEVWNEQNLYYAVGGRIDVAAYARLLRKTYQAVKAVDAYIIVVSGGLVPTGAPPPMAMDDFQYLEALYQQGLRGYCDAVGAHPAGFNVAPWVGGGQAACDFVTQQGSTYLGPCNPLHHAWSFNATLNGYYRIMQKYGDAGKKIWPTEFGWAVAQDPPSGYGFARDNTYQEQADWTVEAFRWAKETGWIGTMVLFNLDYGLAAPGAEFSYWSLLQPSGPVPAYTAITQMPR